MLKNDRKEIKKVYTQMLFSIGEFSRITGLTVKSLRLYHEKGILIPHTIDAKTGYRYYNHQNAEKARAIRILRSFEFSLSDIKEMLEAGEDDADLISALERQKQNLQDQVSNYSKIISTLNTIIQSEKEMQMARTQQTHEVEEKTLDDTLIAGIRFKGKYCDCGNVFPKLCRQMGRYIRGKPLNLYYDAEYKENDADIESCVPVRECKPVEGISVRNLPGGKCISLIHQGSYERLGESYEKIGAYAKEKGYNLKIPSREIYLKGPGMIFRGNPNKYLTEIQMMIEE